MRVVLVYIISQVLVAYWSNVSGIFAKCQTNIDKVLVVSFGGGGI